jgi:hypothetical protein
LLKGPARLMLSAGQMTPPPIPPVIGPLKGKTVRYSLRRGDILRWQFRLLLRNRLLLGFGLGLSLLLVWNDLRSPAFAAYSVGFKVFYAVFFPLTMFALVGSVTMLLMVCMVMFKTYRGLLGEHELEIREQGLVERTEFNESLHRWSGFHKVVRTTRYLYIYVTDNQVHIVPRRCFVSEQEEQAFRDELQRYFKAA